MAKAKVLCSTNRMKTLRHTAVAAIEVDDILLVNGRVCVSYADLAIGESGEMIYAADEIEAPKAAGVAVAAGDAAYWDDANDVFTNVVGTNVLCGIFRKAALAGDAEANLELFNPPA